MMNNYDLHEDIEFLKLQAERQQSEIETLRRALSVSNEYGAALSDDLAELEALLDRMKARR